MSDKSLFSKEPSLDSSKVFENIIPTESARQAWSMFLNWYKVHGSGDVLIPAYIGYTDREGSGVFDPVRDSGLNPRFYPVDNCLKISMDCLQDELEKGGVGVLLVVHWFGLAHVDMQNVRKLCDRFGVYLVEDCAHVLGPIGTYFRELGKVGDAAFFSLHKIYGGEVGGALVWNRPVLAASKKYAEPSCPMNVLEAVFRADVPNIARHRRRLYCQFVVGLTNIKGIDVMFPDIGKYVPQSCAVLVNDGLREKLYFYLLNRGIPLTALYYRLIPEIEETCYSEAFNVSRSILNFPVHQGISTDIVGRIVDETQRAMKVLGP